MSLSYLVFCVMKLHRYNLLSERHPGERGKLILFRFILGEYCVISCRSSLFLHAVYRKQKQAQETS